MAATAPARALLLAYARRRYAATRARSVVASVCLVGAAAAGLPATTARAGKLPGAGLGLATVVPSPTKIDCWAVILCSSASPEKVRKCK